MNAAVWERARDIFDGALDLPAAERSGFVQQACQNDMTLLHEVESLLLADTQAQSRSFLDPSWLAPFSPFASSALDFELRAGDTVCDRYRIIRLLGDGGMGRVYEAYDSVLDVAVALKTLRPEIASSPEVLSRFRQEVRIAHRITHPNVCRTFHLDHEVRANGAHSIDLVFLTMEFLEGETLQQRLKRKGALTLGEALSVVRQLAGAMEAAAAAGIVHRDLKPGNIMLCPVPAQPDAPCRVVVTDFGLAKIEAGNDVDTTSLSTPGRAMGTLSYMAPEQLLGQEVTPATDTYAFGLVLYEMVTGAKAFPNSATMAAAFGRTATDVPPPSARALVPSLPTAWETAILGCLQVAPKARFPHITDVIAILDGTEPHSARLRLLQSAGKKKVPERRYVFAYLLGVAALMALSVFLYRLYVARTAEATVARGALVYLAPIRNETGEKQLDGVSQLVQAGLEQSAHINLLDAGRADEVLQQMAKPAGAPIDASTAREIAMRSGAARVIFPTLSGTSGHYSLNVDMQQPDNTPDRYRNHWTNSWSWQTPTAGNRASVDPELLRAVRDAENWVRHKAGESANDVAQLDAPPADVTTTSWPALSAYTRAQHLAAAQDARGAVVALADAVHEDPGFALAYARMGDLQFALHQEIDGLAAYNAALTTGADRRLSRRERDRIKAMVAIDTLDFQAADDALRDSISFYENDPASWAYRVRPLIRLGRPEEAIASLRKVLSFNPRSEFGLSELANTLLLTGRTGEIPGLLERMRKFGYTDTANSIDAQFHFLTGDLAGAEDLYRKLGEATSAEIRIQALPLLARLRAETGDDTTALRLLDQSVADAETSSRPGFLAGVLLDRASIHGRLNETTPLLADIRRALSLAPTGPNFVAASDILGCLYASSPFSHASVRRALEELKTELPKRDGSLVWDLAHLRLEAEMRLSAGDTPNALTMFRQASVLDAPAGDRAYLGRALVAAAHAANSGRASGLYQEAMSAYAIAALKVGFIWHHPADFTPGSYSAQIRSYTATADLARVSSAEVSTARSALGHLQRKSLFAVPL